MAVSGSYQCIIRLTGCASIGIRAFLTITDVLGAGCTGTPIQVMPSMADQAGGNIPTLLAIFYYSSAVITKGVGVTVNA
jgi:hypothetical protein